MRTLELAKGLAAMANSRGGLLVYGVRDEGHRATELVGVSDPSDGVMERRIRDVAYNFIYPPVQVRCVPLSEGERHVLVVEIPESEESPHLVRPKGDRRNEGWFVAPYRAGSDTNNMVEKQVESAYRQRIDGRRLRDRRLREVHDELAARHVGTVDQDTGTIVAIAQPVRPRMGPLPGPDSARRAVELARSAAILADTVAERLHHLDRLPIAMLVQAGVPRRGLRRFVFTESRPSLRSDRTPVGRPSYLALEIHDSGTLGLVWRRGASYSFVRTTATAPPTPSLAASDMDSLAILLISLVLTMYEDLALATDYQIRVAVIPQSPIYVIPDGHWDGDDYPLVPPPPALEAELRLDSGPDARAADFLAFGHDLNNMLELSYTAIEGFWELPTGTYPDHPRRLCARQILGWEPDHPFTGRAM